MLRRSHHQLLEGLPFRRHVVFGGGSKNVTHLTFQGTMVRCGTPFETRHHTVIELPYVKWLPWLSPEFTAIKMVALHSGRHKDQTVGRLANRAPISRRR